MNKFILYVKVDCPFCHKAEDLLIGSNEEYSIVPFDGAQEVLEHIKCAHDYETVPMIFHVQDKTIKFVGGYTDLVEYLNE